MKTAGPVDCDFRLVVAELPSSVDGTASVEGAVVVQPVEDGAIVAEIEARNVLALLWVLHIAGNDLAEEIEVVCFVKLSHFFVGRFAREIQVHRVVHAVGHDELFGQSQTPGFHRMRLTEMVRFDSWISVPGDTVAFGASDPILLAFMDGLLVEGEGGNGRGGRGVFLDNGRACHDVNWG